jgi:hypothetical protein
MQAEAASAGVYKSPWGAKPYAAIQLLTIAELMTGSRVDYPAGEVGEDRTFRKGPARETGLKPRQERLFK